MIRFLISSFAQMSTNVTIRSILEWFQSSCPTIVFDDGGWKKTTYNVQGLEEKLPRVGNSRCGGCPSFFEKRSSPSDPKGRIHKMNEIYEWGEEDSTPNEVDQKIFQQNDVRQNDRFKCLFY